ncbi:hypothetical protein HC928_01790 [bacterium]|nr:hypothetical protein [bacterium]
MLQRAELAVKGIRDIQYGLVAMYNMENSEQEDTPLVDGSGDDDQSLYVDGGAVPDTQEQAVTIRSWESGNNNLHVRAYDPNNHTPEHNGVLVGQVALKPISRPTQARQKCDCQK